MKVPSYRKHSSDQARVTINGRCFYLGPHGSAQSKKAYSRLIAEYLAGGCQQSFGTPVESLRVSELIAEYVSFAKKYYGTDVNSEYHRIRYSLRVVRRLYGDSMAADFKGLQFKACREVFSSEPIKKKTAVDPDQTDARQKKLAKPKFRSRQYVNVNMRRILRFFKWCASEGRIPVANYEAMRLVPGLRAGKCSLPEASKVVPVEEATVEATLPFLPPIVADMVRLQKLLGCRPSELCSLKPDCIDRSNSVWEVKPSQHKTAHRGHQRIIYVGPKAQQILLPYLLRVSKAFCFCPSEGERNRRKLLHEQRVTPLNQGNKPGKRKHNSKRTPGKQYSVHSYARAIARAAKKAGVAHWSPNQLRHRAATDIRRQFGIEAAQVILGHAQLGVTQVYAQKDQALAIQVAQAVG